MSLRPIAVAAPTISRAWSSCGRIMARLYTLRFLSAVRAVAARCKLPFCPPPRPVPRKCEAHQGNYKRKKSKREGQRKEETKGRPVPLDPSCRRHEVRRGEEQWSPPGARLLRSRSLLVQPLPAPPAQTPRSRRPPLRPAPAFQHPWWRGSLVPPAHTSRPPGGPGSSTGSSTSQSPSPPPPRGFSVGPFTHGTP